MITEAQLAWMAGVIDMKGKIRRTMNKYRVTPMRVLCVETRHNDVVKRLCKLTACRPEYSKAKSMSALDGRRNCVEHCPEPHIHVSKEIPAICRWHVTGAGAAIVLYNLLPFLLYRADMAVFMEEIYKDLPQQGRGRHAVNQAIARLRAEGWAIPDEILVK